MWISTVNCVRNIYNSEINSIALCTNKKRLYLTRFEKDRVFFCLYISYVPHATSDRNLIESVLTDSVLRPGFVRNIQRPATDVDELHVFSLPRQFAVRALQLNGPQVHSDHFVDVGRTAFAEVRKSINPKFILRFLSDPVTDAKYSLNPYLKAYEAASLNPRNRSATAIRFFPASWSSSKKR